jgi:hypothetical protein
VAKDPATDGPIPHLAQKVEALIDRLTSDHATILVPTPCLAELLVDVPGFKAAFQEIAKSQVFAIADFDGRSAVDLATVVRKAKSRSDKKSGRMESWQRLKFDHQIVAITKAHGATTLYTDDHKQIAFAKDYGIRVKRSIDLELPPEYRQPDMFGAKDNS